MEKLVLEYVDDPVALKRRIAKLESALHEIDGLIDGEVDVNDGEDGPVANTAMSVRQVIDGVLPR